MIMVATDASGGMIFFSLNNHRNTNDLRPFRSLRLFSAVSCKTRKRNDRYTPHKFRSGLVMM